MQQAIIDFIEDRIKAIASTLRKTNGEYAQAVKIRKELHEKIDPIITSEKQLTLDKCDFADFQEFLQQEYIIAAIEQSAFYKQGYLDCVDLLKRLGVL